MNLGIYGDVDGRVWDPGVLLDNGLIRVWALEQPSKSGPFFLQPNQVGYYEGTDVDHLERVLTAYEPEYFSNAWHVRKFGGTYYAYFSEAVRHDDEKPDHRARIATSPDGFRWTVKPWSIVYPDEYKAEDGYHGELDPFIVEATMGYRAFIRVGGITWGTKPQIITAYSEDPGEWPDSDWTPILGDSIREKFGETERFEITPVGDKWRLTFSCWRKYAPIPTASNYALWHAESDKINGPYEMVSHQMSWPYGYGFSRSGPISACWRFRESGDHSEILVMQEAA